MARERWFFAQGSQRRGPLPFDDLVDSLRNQSEPRAVMVWRRGLADWTRAEDVPEVERRLATALGDAAARKAAPRPEPPLRDASAALTVEAHKPGSAALVYGGIGAGVGVLVLLAWLFWPRTRPEPPARRALPLGGTSAENAPAVVIPARPQPSAAPSEAPAPSPPPATHPPAPRPAPSAAAVVLADRESDLPRGELKRLRGVATWAGDTLKLTVYNATGWRITELSVRVSRFKDDDFVEDPRPLVLVPPRASVDAGVADLLKKVAPDRKKPGVNPADTGAFEGKAGQQPENFRWEIEAARGYPPR
jgi:hypothetical protein